MAMDWDARSKEGKRTRGGDYEGDRRERRERRVQARMQRDVGNERTEACECCEWMRSEVERYIAFVFEGEVEGGGS